MGTFTQIVGMIVSPSYRRHFDELGAWYKVGPTGWLRNPHGLKVLGRETICTAPPDEHEERAMAAAIYRDGERWIPTGTFEIVAYDLGPKWKSQSERMVLISGSNVGTGGSTGVVRALVTMPAGVELPEEQMFFLLTQTLYGQIENKWVTPLAARLFGLANMQHRLVVASSEQHPGAFEKIARDPLESDPMLRAARDRHHAWLRQVNEESDPEENAKVDELGNLMGEYRALALELGDAVSKWIESGNYDHLGTPARTRVVPLRDAVTQVRTSVKVERLDPATHAEYTALCYATGLATAEILLLSALVGGAVHLKGTEWLDTLEVHFDSLDALLTHIAAWHGRGPQHESDQYVLDGISARALNCLQELKDVAAKHEEQFGSDPRFKRCCMSLLKSQALMTQLGIL